MLPSQDCFNTATCLPCSCALCYCHPYIPVHFLEMIFTLPSLGFQYMQYWIVVLLHVAKVQWGAHKALKPLRQAQCHVLQHCQRLYSIGNLGFARYKHSGSKRHYAHRNEGHMYKRHSDNCRHFWRRSIEEISLIKKKVKQFKGFSIFMAVSLQIDFSYLGGIIG